MAQSAFSPSSAQPRLNRWEALRISIDDLLRQRPHILPLNRRVRARPCDRIDHGLQSVPMYRINRAINRYAVLDALMPAPGSEAEAHPAQPSSGNVVELYRIKDTYFVREGHDDVELAYNRGQVFLSAYVIEYTADGLASTDAEGFALLLQEEHDLLLQQTGLATLRSTQDVATHYLGGSLRLVQHIARHCLDLQQIWQRNITIEIAAASWYDTVYLPVVSIIRGHKLTTSYPHMSEADLYLWATEHRFRRRRRAVAPRSTAVPAPSLLRDRLPDALADLLTLARETSAS